MSPGFAPSRRMGSTAVPSTVMLSVRIGARVVSPPMIGALAAAHASPTPCSTSSSAVSQLAGAPSAMSTPSGSAPMAARSESAAMAARHPISSGVIHARLKCTSSVVVSVLTTRRVPPGTSRMAASSPMPCARVPHCRTQRAIDANSRPGPRVTGVDGETVIGWARAGVATAHSAAVARPRYHRRYPASSARVQPATYPS